MPHPNAGSRKRRKLVGSATVGVDEVIHFSGKLSEAMADKLSAAVRMSEETSAAIEAHKISLFDAGPIVLWFTEAMKPMLLVKSPQGVMHCHAGDYIVRDGEDYWVFPARLKIPPRIAAMAKEWQ